MSRAARFEIVHTNIGWTVRFRAANGKVIVSSGSQAYATRRAARHAIALIAAPFDAYLTDVGVRPLTDAIEPTEVRDVDERTPPSTGRQLVGGGEGE